MDQEEIAEEEFNMDDLSISNGINFGSNPATLLGNQSIEQIQQQNGSQYTALADLISTYANASVGTANLQDGSVTNAKIANLFFEVGVGRTLTLGGSNNGDGLLVIENSSGNKIIQGDNLGLHLYDSSGNNLVTLDDLGLHVYNGSGGQLVLLNNTGLHTYNGSSTLLSEFTSSAVNIYGNNTLAFKQNPSSSASGLIGTIPGGTFLVGSANSNAMQVAGETTLGLFSLGGDLTIESSNNINISPVGSIYMYGQKVFFSSTASDYEFGLSGTTPVLLFNGNLKSAIVPTSIGYRALYTNESPEVYFMDFVKGIKKRKFPLFWEYEYILEYDPLFLETVEIKDPPIIMETINKQIFQVWFHRKGYKNIRFEKKTKKQFMKNNDFWNTPNM